MKGGVLWVEHGGGSSGGKRVYFREGKRFVEGFIYCAAVVVFVTQERGGGVVCISLGLKFFIYFTTLYTSTVYSQS